LIYPPPWKIPCPGEPAFPRAESAPAGIGGRLDADFIQAPCGLLSLAAQALDEGHEATVLNLSNASWQKVETSIRRRPAPLFGLSCVTANRRGVFLTAGLIRKTHPEATIVVGGPHVTALPRETLLWCGALDAVVLGEGEATFMEIVRVLAAGKPLRGIAGTAWKENGHPVIGPPRAPVEDLDRIIAPNRYFPMRKILTSRGCPGRCTFCCSSLMWGQRVRFHSVGYVLDTIERAVRVYRQQILSFKDDTFTSNRQRVLSICREIRNRKLDFIWSCDTRADCLDEEVLGSMRRAGCQRISIGVESCADSILSNIKKRISPTMVADATKSAQKFGIRVRWFMMAGNRGETRETFQQSLDFIRAGRPNQFVFTQLHLYPGTEEFDIFCRSGVVDPEIYFNRDFADLTCFAGKREDAEAIYAVLGGMQGIQDLWEPGVEDCRQILEATGGLPAARMDLASALIQADCFEEADQEIRRSRQDGYCLPGRVYNCLACIAAGRGHLDAAEAYLDKAMSCHPHQVVIDNMIRLSAKAEGVSGEQQPVQLDPRIRFETTFLRQSPEFPDPDPVLDTALEYG
jgi:radical SAM superfamily enzyme YgiQ (UPF0313 family)